MVQLTVLKDAMAAKLCHDTAVGKDGFLRLDATAKAKRTGLCDDSGQSTTEYAFILVVVAVIGLALYAVGPDKIQQLFGAIIDKMTGDAGKVSVKVPK